jgi:hypothetical protein
MPAYDSGSYAISWFVAADERIAALEGEFVNGAPQVWLTGNLTYSFPTGASYFDGGLGYGRGEVSAGWAPLNSAQRDAVRSALAAWSNVANVTFTEVADGITVGDIRFAFTSQGVGLGHAYLPLNQNAAAGDVWIDTDLITQTFVSGHNVNGAFGTPDRYNSQGALNYMTLLHEIGHALGLSHPFAEPGVTRGTAAVNATWADTVMSYTAQDPYFGGAPTTPMVWDILAMQYLYGPNLTYRTGNDTYTYDENNINWETIWDAGGTDTLVITNTTNLINGVVINLNEGAYSGVGFGTNMGYSLTRGYQPAFGLWLAGYEGTGRVAIAYGTTIENIVTPDMSDVITGNAANNRITSGFGHDVIDGGGGVDTSVYSLARSHYTVQKGGAANSYTVANHDSNPMGITTTYGLDTLTNVERLAFSDFSLALDLDGNAGKVARLIGALWGPTGLQDKELVGLGLSLVDAGIDYTALMGAAINYHFNLFASSNSLMVDTIYYNVTGHLISQPEHDLFLGLLDNGSLTLGKFGVIAANSTFNADHINLVGLAESGLAYIPA